MASSRTRPPEADLVAHVGEVLQAAGIGRDDRLCLALSGGVDSSVLLEILARQRPRIGFALTAAHVNHGLSPHADAWCRFCEAACARLGVGLSIFRVEVARDDPAGLEAAARAVRLAALSGVSADWLVFAHHQDDQAETVLFRLLRGAGVLGAGAMKAREAGVLGRLRPLLAIRRASIEAFAAAKGIAWVEDESNADPRFSRNFLRHKVFAPLEAEFPAAVPMLARAAGHFQAAGELLDDLAAIDFETCGGDTLALERLLRLSDRRLCNLLRWMIRRANDAPPSSVRINEVVRQLRATSGAPACLALGAHALTVYRGGVRLMRHTLAGHSSPWHGEASLAWGDGRIVIERQAGAGLDQAALSAAGSIVFTTRWSGLAMRLSLKRPRRTFKNLCQEAGVPAWRRDGLPVMQVDGEAVWIAGVGFAAEWCCPPDAAGVVPHWLPPHA